MARREVRRRRKRGMQLLSEAHRRKALRDTFTKSSAASLNPQRPLHRSEPTSISPPQQRLRRNSIPQEARNHAAPRSYASKRLRRHLPQQRQQQGRYATHGAKDRRRQPRRRQPRAPTPPKLSVAVSERVSDAEHEREQLARAHRAERGGHLHTADCGGTRDARGGEAQGAQRGRQREGGRRGVRCPGRQ